MHSEGLADHFRFHGNLDQSKLASMYRSCYAVIVPTRTTFAEGFNKVVAEGILAEKPVITSTVCPATEYFREGLVLVKPDDTHAYADAILRLGERSRLLCRFRARGGRSSRPALRPESLLGGNSRAASVAITPVQRWHTDQWGSRS